MFHANFRPQMHVTMEMTSTWYFTGLLFGGCWLIIAIASSCSYIFASQYWITNDPGLGPM